MFYELHTPLGITTDTDSYEWLVLYMPNLFHHTSTICLRFVRYAPCSGLGKSMARRWVISDHGRPLVATRVESTTTAADFFKDLPRQPSRQKRLALASEMGS